mmetsp:Transcript_25858/g.44589  ORF Transcript_25858/g.44589 Transcript_25858/m.44589 type:complete len:229 (+) Transcript_25858:66-752(+)
MPSIKAIMALFSDPSFRANDGVTNLRTPPVTWSQSMEKNNDAADDSAMSSPRNGLNGAGKSENSRFTLKEMASFLSSINLNDCQDDFIRKADVFFRQSHEASITQEEIRTLAEKLERDEAFPCKTHDQSAPVPHQNLRRRRMLSAHPSIDRRPLFSMDTSKKSASHTGWAFSSDSMILFLVIFVVGFISRICLNKVKSKGRLRIGDLPSLTFSMPGKSSSHPLMNDYK